MNRKNLDKIIRRHQHWLKEDCKGWRKMQADLSGADLAGLDLHGVNLSRVDLSGANLSRANLSYADLSEANLSGANLTESNFEHADIYTAIFDTKENHRKGIVLAKPIKGYKRTDEGVVITAEIPAGAVVFSINGDKCRTNIATITAVAGHKVLHSIFNPSFTYKKGQKILITDFDTRYNIECGPGFHFFRTKKEAKDI